MAVLGGAGGWIYQTWQKIPSSIRIRAGEEQELFLDVPVSGTIYGEKTAQELSLINICRCIIASWRVENVCARF